MRNVTPISRVTQAVLVVAIVASWLGACGSMVLNPDDPPAVKLWKSYGPLLEAAVGVREEVLRAAGRANRDGQLADEDLELVRAAGDTSKIALEGATSALQRLMSQPADLAQLDKVLAAQKAIQALVRLAVELGFWEVA